MIRLRPTILTMIALLVAAPLHAGEVVAEFNGSRNARTASFEVDGPWLLRWRINSDYRMTSAFELNLVDADSGYFDSRVLQRRSVGHGIKLFRNTGRFRFEISANFIDWYLTVESLTEEEAAEWVPANR